MAPRAERYDPKKSHGMGCKRLCCNGKERFYDPREDIYESHKINYLRTTLYIIGVVAFLSTLTYCSQPKKGEPRKIIADISQKIN